MYNVINEELITEWAVSYYRYSTDMQNETSIEGQKRLVKTYAELHNIGIEQEYIDRAKSGGNDKRDGLMQMIDDIKSGKTRAKYILVYKLDRLFRNEELHRQYERELKNYGVHIISVTEEQANDESISSKIVKSILLIMNEHELNKISQNVIRGLKETAYQGKWCGGTPPLGYDVDKSTQKLIINEAEAKAVRLAFKLRGEGFPYAYICEKLNQKGYKTKHGNKFGKNSLHEMFSNKKYKGVVEYNKSASKSTDGTFNRHASKPDSEIIITENGCPRLVSDTLWDKVNAMGKKNSSVRPKGEYLLSGYVVCKCGTVMQVNRRTKDGKEYVSFFCPKHKNKEGCDAKEINMTVLEEFILHTLSNIIFSKNYINQFIGHYNELNKVKARTSKKVLAKLKSEVRINNTKIQNLLSRIEQGCDEIVAKTIENKIKELKLANEKVAKNIKKHNTEKSDTPTYNDVLQLKSIFISYMQSKVNLPIRKQLISELVEQITVYDDRIEAILNI